MVRNLVGADWIEVSGPTLPVLNPATGEEIDQVPLSPPEAVDAAVAAAVAALPGWARTSIMERVRHMFAYKALLESHFEELAALVTRQHGKTLEEARGEVRRGIEVVDFACGAPTLLQGRSLRNVSRDVDQAFARFPVGVCAGIPPFNFPVMIPLWMFPLATVAGNTFVLKPSERTPVGARLLASLFLEAGFPPGVLNVVNGARETVDALITHRDVSAVSFVGSEPVARHIYATAAGAGKRVQALGGAKNHIVVMPDADLELVVPAVLNSAFGNAGERCLAGSVAIGVGKIGNDLSEALVSAASKLKVGDGSVPGVDIGPVIRKEHRDFVIGCVEQGEREGALIALDGRAAKPVTDGKGYFLGPTILDQVRGEMAINQKEIFGPVLSLSYATSLDAALSQANSSALGNMAVIFTSSGKSARRFQEEVQAGMIGINVPIAQPFAFFPFSGWKNSFFGDLHAHGTDGVEFYTRKKTVISRW